MNKNLIVYSFCALIDLCVSLCDLTLTTISSHWKNISRKGSDSFLWMSMSIKP